jgi:hypothetical protein
MRRSWLGSLAVAALALAGATPAPAATGLSAAPAGIVADRPEWPIGGRWVYEINRSHRVTFEVARREAVDGHLHYVLRRALGGVLSEDYYTADLHYRMTRRAPDWATVRRAAPATQSYAWPLEIGKRWQQVFRMFGPRVQDGRATGTLDWETELRARAYEVLALEKVTVPAGTFRAFRIAIREQNWAGEEETQLWYAPEVRRYVKAVRGGLFPNHQVLLEYALPHAGPPAAGGTDGATEPPPAARPR